MSNVLQIFVRFAMNFNHFYAARLAFQPTPISVCSFYHRFLTTDGFLDGAEKDHTVTY